MSKKDMLIDIVTNENYCLWELFCENVVSDGTDKFAKAYKDCKTRDDLRKLVNKYI